MGAGVVSVYFASKVRAHCLCVFGQHHDRGPKHSPLPVLSVASREISHSLGSDGRNNTYRAGPSTGTAQKLASRRISIVVGCSLGAAYQPRRCMSSRAGSKKKAESTRRSKEETLTSWLESKSLRYTEMACGQGDGMEIYP
eukprot:scaffold276295_cov33-Tisochrysis_lutea.AAC.2